MKGREWWNFSGILKIRDTSGGLFIAVLDFIYVWVKHFLHLYTDFSIYNQAFQLYFVMFYVLKHGYGKAEVGLF